MQGSNIQTAPTTTNNVTTYAAMGGLTKKSGDSTVATQTQAAYQQKNVGEAFSLTESFTLGDESISVSATTGVLIEDYAQTSATSTTSTTTATADDGTVTNTVNTATTPQVQNYGVATSLPVFGDTTTTAGGYTGNLAGTITSGGTVTLTAGGAGTSYWSSNQHINNQMINEEDTCPDCGCVCPCECEDCSCCARGA